MLAALPIVAFLSLWSLLAARSPSNNVARDDGRDAFLTAAIVWGVFTALVTEALSLVRALSPFWLALTWGLALLALWLYAWRTRVIAGSLRSWSELFYVTSIRRYVWLLLIALGFYMVSLGIIAWVAPPNTNDSLAYHMSRVMHWAQNGSLAHYATPINRQIWMPSFAETAILNFVLLLGSDRLANFVQWFSMLGSLVGVSLIAKRLGASATGQIFAAVFCATIPMGVLQATGTQTDYVASFWVVTIAYYVVLQAERDLNLSQWFLLSAAVGLGVLTKGTVYAYALPFLVWLAVIVARRHGWTASVRYALLGLVVVLVINLGVWNRNSKTYGFPLGPPDRVADVSNDSFGLAPTLSNVVRNLALHIATPSRDLNEQIKGVIVGFHSLIGQDVNNPNTTMTQFDISWVGWRHEDFAGNPLHVFLIPLSLIALGLSRSARHRKPLTLYTLAVVATFVVFSALNKWQPWGSRLQLPFFVLFAPVFGAVFDGQRWTLPGAGLSTLLLIAGLPILFFNASRPLLGQRGAFKSIFERSREELLFTNRRLYREAYLSVSERLRSTTCDEIGLKLGSGDPEYPLWVLLGLPGTGIRLESLDVDAPLDRYQPLDFRPCAVICTTCSGNDPVYELKRDGIHDDFLRLYLDSQYAPE